MPASGWKQLLAGAPWFQGDGNYPIAAYSEYMPPARLGCKPYGGRDPFLFCADDPWGWQVNEYEEHQELRPGLEIIGRQIVHALVDLGAGRHAHGISRNKLTANPYWPEELSERAGKLKHEHYVILMPLALSRTQDDKGRLRWTLFGSSEQGPARAFWKSFYGAPGRERPAEEGLAFIRNLLNTVYGESQHELADLRRTGFRIMPLDEDDVPFPYWREKKLPAWTSPFLWAKGEKVRGVKYLLTFRPFSKLPQSVRAAYLAGELHLLPFPGSLLFWGVPTYLRLQRDFPLGVQIPLLHSLARHERPFGIRIPQSGWLHEPKPNEPSPNGFYGPVRNTYRRTHRWARVHQHEDELVLAGEDNLAHVVFSAAAEDLGLYGKPMARNVQIWSDDFCMLLDGPRAAKEDIHRAAHALAGGGMFGYRFVFPAMRVGRHEVYWHRPLVGYWSAQKNEPALIADAPLGFLSAYRRPDGPSKNRAWLDHFVELWPRILQRGAHLAAVQLFDHAHDPHEHRTATNVRKLLNAHTFFPAGLPESFARQLLALPRHENISDWLGSLPVKCRDMARGGRLAQEIRQRLETSCRPGPERPQSLTFDRTARRTFEVKYWKTIADLATGKYVNKDNADCVTDEATRARLPHHHRDLDALGDYVLDHYERIVARQHMTGKALVGDVPFRWRTDFDFPWMGGWLNNQHGHAEERDLIVVIPGRDRRRAVIMADHYDTAYMEDCYDKEKGGSGARLAAAGADDNHSASAALMLGAEVFLELSKQGKLACDIWLVHLTGEEFPSDCLGARNLCQRLVEGTLKVRLRNGRWRDLSRARVQGVYVLDMVAHNNDHNRDVFQISPGTGPASLWLAYQAHLANETWNAWAPVWNQRASRRGRQRGKRSADGAAIPETALHPHLAGEVRPPYDPRSTLFNTDGQIFSDAGIPVVLFMENYDINRTGYHDTHDTMANIDLDYGAALAAIAIESVARAASEKPHSHV